MEARQRGVAVVTALLLTALAVTLVTGIFWQQQIMVRGMEGQRLRLQGRLIARGALDAARLALLDSAAVQGNVTTLDGGWNVPLYEERLERFLGQAPEPVRQGARRAQAEDRGADDGAGGRLAQQIADAQACFNLRNLVGRNGVDLFQATAFARLLATLRLDAGLAYPIAEVLAGRRGEIEVQQLDDLRSVPGVSEEVLARLRGFVVVLPAPTPVNVNTASPEVLTSVVNFSLSEAQQLAEHRRQANFKGLSDFAVRLNERETLEGVDYAVTSEYFLVHSTLTLARATLHTEALIRRSGGAALVWVHND